MLAFAVALACAEPLPDASLDRAAQKLVVHRYGAVVGDGPFYPRGRQRSGRIEAWTFPDWQIEHYREHQGGQVVLETRYDAEGAPISTLTWEDGLPAKLEIGGVQPRTFTIGDWPEVRIGPALVRVPEYPDETAADRVTWSQPTFALTLATTAATGSVLDDAFRTDLADACACLLDSRAPAWADGVPGVSYRFHLPSVDPPLVGELWAFEQDGDVVVISHILVGALARPGTDSHPGLSRGRAVVATLRWKPLPD